jgi:DNA-binding NarL/FixJ family response regulator
MDELIEPLTPRELEVVQTLWNCRTLRNDAREKLGIEESTFITHLKAVRGKLGVRTDGEMWYELVTRNMIIL